MTGAGGTPTSGRDPRAALAELVHAYLARRSGWPEAARPVEVLDAEVLRRGRPGLVDVVARAGERTVHVPMGLRAPGDEVRFLPDGDDHDPVLGLFDDGEGLAVAVCASRDGEVAVALLEAVCGETADPLRVRQIRSDDVSLTLAFDDRLALTVFDDVSVAAQPGVETLLALDDAGFNHLPAPVAVWRRGGRDLGLVQEYLAGCSSGWALALTSVRDLYATGGDPADAGGDFGSEAHRLGQMTARMHLALDQAFGRRRGDVGAWVAAAESALAAGAPEALARAEVTELLAELRGLDMPCPAIRTHGDFHLGRVCRTELGWFVTDVAPGGHPGVAGVPGRAGNGSPAFGSPAFCSPLEDVADMLWALGHIATATAAERDPSGTEGLAALAGAWQTRNRRAYLAGYLGMPGIAGLVPASRDVVRKLAALFELRRSAGLLAGTTAT